LIRFDQSIRGEKGGAGTKKLDWITDQRAGASLALRATLLSSMRCKRARANKVREREKEIQEEISNAMSV
jgi:hypothetical protein